MTKFKNKETGETVDAFQVTRETWGCTSTWPSWMAWIPDTRIRSYYDGFEIEFMLGFPERGQWGDWIVRVSDTMYAIWSNDLFNRICTPIDDATKENSQMTKFKEKTTGEVVDAFQMTQDMWTKPHLWPKWIPRVSTAYSAYSDSALSGFEAEFNPGFPERGQWGDWIVRLTDNQHATRVWPDAVFRRSFTPIDEKPVPDSQRNGSPWQCCINGAWRTCIFAYKLKGTDKYVVVYEEDGVEQARVLFDIGLRHCQPRGG